MCARSDQPDRRDEAIGRLLAQALKHPAAARSAACPDAEFVAAYAEQALPQDERVQLESHFADCAHCQQVLAALGAALEEPAGASVAVLPVPAPAAPAAIRPERTPRRWLWWLSPAFGAAAAALLWMALRPAAPEPVQTAANFPAAAEQESRALSAPAASAPQQSSQGSSPAPRDPQTRDRLATPAPSATAELEKDAASGIREQAFAAPPVPPAPPAPPAPEPPVRSEIASAEPPPPATAQAMTAPTPAAPGAQPAAPPSRDNAIVANEIAPLQSRTMAAPQPLSAPGSPRIVLYTVSAPQGDAVWRLGTAGLIERSTDRGRTWQPQASGVTNDLIAGSASSTEVAWIVGRGGAILRTTNGQTWERIAPPPGITAEWAAVAAHDAMNATVVAEDLRRFSTRDGGRTWLQQQ